MLADGQCEFHDEGQLSSSLRRHQREEIDAQLRARETRMGTRTVRARKQHFSASIDVGGAY